jgi:tetratricopeptide (TPR) repeat protein
LHEQGDAAAALTAYDNGVAEAKRQRNERGALSVLIAKATMMRVRGDLAAAGAVLNRIVRRAAEVDERDVLARAAHERGIVAYEQGRYDHALVDFGDAFEAYADARRRIRLLSDVGRSFRALGMLTDARDALIVVFQLDRGDPTVHWAAGITLMTLAVDLNNVVAFDQYRISLAGAPMPARLLAGYLLAVGDGYQQFGRPAEARCSPTTMPRAWQPSTRCLSRSVTRSPHWLVVRCRARERRARGTTSRRKCRNSPGRFAHSVRRPTCSGRELVTGEGSRHCGRSSRGGRPRTAR